MHICVQNFFYIVQQFVGYTEKTSLLFQKDKN
jgi:hypothetical protein